MVDDLDGDLAEALAVLLEAMRTPVADRQPFGSQDPHPQLTCRQRTTSYPNDVDSEGGDAG